VVIHVGQIFLFFPVPPTGEINRDNNILNIMPQLLPFYFVNQFVFAVAALFTITYIMSVYILPYFVNLFVTRVYITKL